MKDKVFNRLFFFVLFFLAFPFFLSSALGNVKRGLTPTPILDSKGNQVSLYNESHALVIGVSKYSNGWPVLPGVKKDTDQVVRALHKNGFNTIIATNPSYKEIRTTIEGFINKYGQDINNRLLFYFAGHGHTLKLSFGEEMGYFVPVDAPHPDKDKAGFLSKGLNMELMQVYAKQIQSKHALFIFDSCFSGSFFSISRSVPDNISYKTSQPVRQFITSGSADEQVPDVSIFREQFVSALSGEGDIDSDGFMTGTELGEFLQKKVINYSKGSQHPQYGKMRNPRLDKGDFVFALKSTNKSDQIIDILEEKKKLSAEQTSLEIEKNRLVEIRRLVMERKKIKKERERVKEQRIRIASKQPKQLSTLKTRSQKCPDKMTLVDGRVLIAEIGGKVQYEANVQTLCVDTYEVTQKQYELVMDSNPSHFTGVKSRPVENVSWYQAKKYCQNVGKRLPTEWEWVNAAGFKKNVKYYWGNEFDPGFAWFIGNSSSRTNPVGQKKPNPLGLHDMVGNVWEWTDSGENKLKYLRGGSWNTYKNGMKISDRRLSDPEFTSSTFGFRCVQ
ncbi:MAG: SUMF1/EgtB/PvdO family nonheme iron enzyme [Nitrospina sp.]|nr:SUMF1/EgtB/PvdO family nonheme iron enzyme [Nitrospina sp.]